MNDIESRLKKARQELFFESLKENKWAFILFFSFASIYFIFLDSPTESRQGIVIGSTYSNTDDGNKITLIVELKNGSKVRASIPNKYPLKVGGKVEILEAESILFGYKTYSFVRYYSNKNK